MFSYKTYLPSPPLRKYIQKYRFVNGSSIPAQLIPVQSTLWMMINYGDSFTCTESNKSTMRFAQNIYFSGVFLNPKYLEAAKNLKSITVDFNIEYAGGILQENMCSLSDTVLSCENIKNSILLSWLPDALASAKNDTQKIAILDKAFEKFFSVRKVEENYFFLEIDKTIHRFQGNTDMAQLSDDIGFSERTLRRKFLESIGISPYQYCRIIRAQFALAKLLFEPAIRISDIVNDLGYFDQSHFINDMKKSFCLTPDDIKKSTNSPQLNILKTTLSNRYLQTYE